MLDFILSKNYAFHRWLDRDESVKFLFMIVLVMVLITGINLPFHASPTIRLAVAALTLLLTMPIIIGRIVSLYGPFPKSKS